MTYSQFLRLFPDNDACLEHLKQKFYADGTECPRCQSSRAFARNILRLRDLPIAFWDERLSSAAVNRMLIDEHDVNRKQRGEVVDKLAATYILQGALERLRNTPNPT